MTMRVEQWAWQRTERTRRRNSEEEGRERDKKGPIYEIGRQGMSVI